MLNLKNIPRAKLFFPNTSQIINTGEKKFSLNLENGSADIKKKKIKSSLATEGFSTPVYFLAIK